MAKKLKPILVRYLGVDALRHPCDTGGHYFFAGRSPVVVEAEKDIAFYTRKAKMNPETWAIGEEAPPEESKAPEEPKEKEAKK